MNTVKKVLDMLERRAEEAAEAKDIDVEYFRGFYDGLASARREVRDILEEEISINYFLQTPISITAHQTLYVQYVLNGHTITPPHYEHLDNYYFEDYKEINGTFYIFIVER